MTLPLYYLVGLFALTAGLLAMCWHIAGAGTKLEAPRYKVNKVGGKWELHERSGVEVAPIYRCVATFENQSWAEQELSIRMQG